MAYENFIPEVWDKKIERDLERLCVYVEDCNRKYEGEVKRCGDTVHITGVGKPKISTLARENADDDITGPETVDGTDTILVIDQIRYFNFMVGDIDKAQALDGLLDELTAEANEGLANEVDTYIAGLVANAGLAVTEAALTADNVLKTLNKGQMKLFENDVKPTTEVSVVVPPSVSLMLRDIFINKDTNNSELLKKGKVAEYGNMTIKMSNNVNKTTGDGSTTYNMMMRTKRAVAYAQPLRHIEPYRPEGKFADAVKGLHLYGAKVVYPKELVCLDMALA